MEGRRVSSNTLWSPLTFRIEKALTRAENLSRGRKSISLPFEGNPVKNTKSVTMKGENIRSVMVKSNHTRAVEPRVTKEAMNAGDEKTTPHPVNYKEPYRFVFYSIRHV